MTHSSINEFSSELGRVMAGHIPPTEPLSPPNLLPLDSELANDHSALLDLAYEEYCRAMDRGESLDQQAFAAQFPQIEQSLLELLEVHSFVVGNSLLTDVEPDIHWPTPGEEFLGFELLEGIGQGAFSRVFLAREVDLGNRQVVVKVSQKGATEATRLGLLDHPNIIPIHSISTDAAVNLSALCMPYLGRATAAEWIQTRFKASRASRVKSGRHLESVIEIGKGVCQGLQFAHTRQILHCDIKPSNILITHDGEPLLLDFNLSADQTQETHLIGGTLMYMAPEQLLRASGDRTATITPKTDVFCLGATLYQMATGQLPFPLGSSSNPRMKPVIEAALDVRRAFQQRIHPLPEPLLSTLRDALAFDPKDRIPSATELYERLAASHNKQLRPRYRARWILAVTGTLALGLTAAYIRNEEFKSPETSERQSRTANAQPRPASPTPVIEVDPLRIAEKAERESRYPEAIAIYRGILRGEIEIPNLTEKLKLSLKHSLAYCLMMDGQYIEANMTFTELHSRGYAHEAFQLNRAACLVLLSVTPQGLEDWELLEKTRSIVNDLVLTRGKSTEHLHAQAVLFALLAKLEAGANRSALLDRSLFWESCALGIGLPKGKALAIGHEMPAANEKKLLLQLIKENPQLTPDLSIDLPVQSPMTGEKVMANAVLP